MGPRRDRDPPLSDRNPLHATLLRRTEDHARGTRRRKQRQQRGVKVSANFVIIYCENLKIIFFGKTLNCSERLEVT